MKSKLKRKNKRVFFLIQIVCEAGCFLPQIGWSVSAIGRGGLAEKIVFYDPKPKGTKTKKENYIKEKGYNRVASTCRDD